MIPQIQSINIHELVQHQRILSSAPITHTTPLDTLPSGLESLVTPLLNDTYSSLKTTNEQPPLKKPSLIFILKISKDILELEEKKEGKTRIFKLIFGSRFLSINQRRAMEGDFKHFSERLKLLGLHLQKKTYTFWTTLLKDVELTFQPMQNSAALSKKTAGTLLQLAQKITRTLVKSPPPATTENDNITHLQEVKEIVLSTLGTAQKIIFTNSELVKNNQNTVYTFTITASYATFVEESPVMKNKWELDLINLKSTLNQEKFNANSALWLTMKIDSIFQDLLSKKAEMYKK